VTNCVSGAGGQIRGVDCRVGPTRHEPTHGRNEILVPGNEDFSSRAADEVFVCCAGLGDDSKTAQAGELYGQEADSSGGSRHEEPLARLQREGVQRLVCCRRVQADGSELHEVDSRRCGCQLTIFQKHKLRVRAEIAVESFLGTDDGVADLESGHHVTYCGDDSGDVGSETELLPTAGGAVLHVHSRADHDVCEVHRSAGNFHEHLSWSGLRGLDVDNLDDVGATKASYYCCAHGLAPFSCWTGLETEAEVNVSPGGLDEEDPSLPSSSRATFGWPCCRNVASMEMAIGEFLRSRRDRIFPADVGLPAGMTRRRVKGLRREEVALLAGVSPDYYIRLEQGRTGHVSDQILNAVAHALSLSEVETEHLQNLARTSSEARIPEVSPHSSDSPDPVSRLLAAMTDAPALLLDSQLDIVEANSLAESLFELRGTDTYTTAVRPNAARLIFLHPEARSRYQNWDDIAAETVAQLRLMAGRWPGDVGLNALIQELATRSDPFRKLWATGDVHEKREGTVKLRHPMVGSLTFDYQMMTFPAHEDRFVLVYLPQPGTDTSEALALLTSWDADASFV
jgi:transcriptional regulator with XRE-family HTH domain